MLKPGELPVDLLNAILRVLPQGVVVIDPSSQVMMWNRQFERMFSFPPGYVRVGLPFAALTQSIAERRVVNISEFDETMRRRLREPVDGDVIDLPLADGRRLEIRRHAASDGSLVTTYFDVTERWRLEQKLREDAKNDALTGLGNRSSFDEQLAAALGSRRRVEPSGALVLLDLNRFKSVNDKYGHPAGDALLIHVAASLRKCFRTSDAMARLGGDEFAVICPGPSTVDEAVRPVAALLGALRNPVFLGESTIAPSIAIGIALYPQHGEAPLELYEAADRALYRAKKQRESAFETAQVADG